MACVYIPVQNTSEEVRVALEQLPADATDILDILKAEQAPLNLWLTFAREYFKQGKVVEFLQILEEGSSPEIDEYYSDVKYDRIAILNALGAYYTNLGRVEAKQREKDEHFIRATQYYNKASRIDQDEASTWVGKGQLLVAKGELEQAQEVFKIVLDGQRDNVAALLGQACVQFNSGRFQDALKLYKRALQIHPQCPASVRLGLGLCRVRLGEFKKAQQAFDRVLQLDGNNVEALVASGILDLNSGEEGRVHIGLEKMQAAYEIYPYCSMALNHLSSHYFFTDQHFMVEQLTEAALAATDHTLIKAQSYYNLARSCHTKEDYEMAARYYRASTAELKNPKDFILPYFGLGQVHLKLGDWKAALASFEKVLELYPDNCETLKAIGHILGQQGRKGKALEHFKKATRMNPRDVDAWLEMGELLVSSDFAAALESFQTAHTLLKKNQEVVPLGLLNNIGVLHFEKGELEAARKAYKQALGDGIWMEYSGGHRSVDVVSAIEDDELFRRLEEEGVSLDVPAEKVTVLFNLARLHEQLHETGKASVLYRLILYKHPQYEDAYLRLGALSLARSNISTSLELVNKALNANDRNVEALSVRGNLEVKTDDWLKAKDTFKGILEIKEGNDNYAMLALGNWNYYAATRGEKKVPKLEAIHLDKARELYQKVLGLQPNNMYAANGIGVVLAEKGMFDISKDIFTQVQEAATGNLAVDMPDVWINLGHIYLAQGQFGLAVKMYLNCLKRFYHNTDHQILLYLARTHYEAEQWQECKRVLLRAIHLAPSNYMLRFDVAVAMQKFSTATLQKAKRTADEVRQAVFELKNALRLFSQLAGVKDQQVHGFDEKKLGMHDEYCKHLLDAAKVHLEAAEREEQQLRQKQEVARQVAMAEEARRKAEDERRLQLERRQREAEQRLADELEYALQEKKATWNIKKGHADEGEDGGGKKEKKKRKKKEKKIAAQDSDGEEGRYSPQQVSDEDVDDVPVKSQGRKKKRRQAVSDSEEEGEMTPAGSPVQYVDQPSDPEPEDD
ncbi:hypothetical protein KC19_4G184500 [Ceratodon purpureus]|uniref:Uncharacterized protein n=1 Tax=Ceratodon purpureus TaxID=3225 RepID=A0A8T0IA70_CERPU|nr:hypothetical protein KC19_4G184500 [Ceratodon purpureus]